MSRSLDSLARAAQRNQSSANSTASTRYSGTPGPRRFSSGTPSYWIGCDAGDLSDVERERIRDWSATLGTIDEVAHQNPPFIPSPAPESPPRDTLQVPSRPRVRERASTITESSVDGSRTTITDASTALTTPDLEEDDDDDEFKREILQNHEELGRLSFAKGDYVNAITFLQEAIAGATGASSDPGHFEKLKLQLSICYCLQGKWEAGEGVLISLGKGKRETDLPVYHLLHAVALAHLAESRHERAYSACKRSLQGKKKAQGKSHKDYLHSLSLLASICDAWNKPTEAAAIRFSIPEGKLQETFPSPVQYIQDHRFIIEGAFGDHATPAVAQQNDDEGEDHHSDAGSVAGGPSRSRSGNHQLGEQDTGKEISVDSVRLPSQVGGWDTGKEIMSGSMASGEITTDPSTGRRIFSTTPSFDAETGKILAWPDWGRLKWVDLMVYLSNDGPHIYELMVDDEVRQLLGLPRQGMRDEEKHSDLLVVALEQTDGLYRYLDSEKEVIVTPPPLEPPPRPPAPAPPSLLVPSPTREPPRPPTPNLIDLDTDRSVTYKHLR